MHRERHMASDIPGGVVRDEVLPPGRPWGRVVRSGEVLRIVDLEGKQGVDFLCFNAADPAERYHAPNTIKAARSLRLTKGHVLYSDLARPMFTMIEDTCGFHDTIAGCCGEPSNRMLYGVAGAPGCRENLLAALAGFGLGRKEIVSNLNFFCDVPILPGNRLLERTFADGPSRPGDYVDLRAEMEAIVAVSNCPQVNNPAAGMRPTPIRLVVWQAG